MSEKYINYIKVADANTKRKNENKIYTLHRTIDKIAKSFFQTKLIRQKFIKTALNKSTQYYFIKRYLIMQVNNSQLYKDNKMESK